MNSKDLLANKNQQSTLPSIFTLNYLLYGLSVYLLHSFLYYTYIYIYSSLQYVHV